jgi:hypothetical protein
MLIGLIIFVVIAAGVILLQIFLSKRESKWPGLILPVIFFCISLLAAFGTVIVDDISPFIEIVLMAFLLCNIPTCLLLAIYFICRSMQKKRKALDKMRAQDLE